MILGSDHSGEDDEKGCPPVEQVWDCEGLFRDTRGILDFHGERSETEDREV